MSIERGTVVIKGAPGASVSSRSLPIGASIFVLFVVLWVVWGAEVRPHDVLNWLSAKRDYAAKHPATTAAAFALFYVMFTALSLPGVWTLSVAGGALFGPWIGAPLIAISSTLGATLAMFTSRYLLRDVVASRFPRFVQKVDRGIDRDGSRWLFAARLLPVIPFFVVNLAVGLTNMRIWVFATVTLVGVLPFTVIYSVAGSQFAAIKHPGDLISGRMLAAFAAVAVAPFVLKLFMRRKADDDHSD
jgi:uncharacterized membrane protein YdjX (TVP38/TMEM64 family)